MKPLMVVDRSWKFTRKLVPLQVYPLLAPVYRWRRRRHCARLEEDDRTYRASHPGVLAPSVELRYNVLGGPATIEQFLSRGERMVVDIEAALRSADKSLAQVRDFLDFGCGCGGLMIALRGRWPDLRVMGCDVDERAVRWCQQHLGDSRTVVNDALPPSPFQDGAFDLVWCGSVFTHLDENRQDRWLAEMRRILRPGGMLLASVHGRYNWEARLPPWTIANLRKKGMIFARIGHASGIHPSWYQVAWHTEEYIRRHWARAFEIRGYKERGVNDSQDIVIARKGGPP